MLVVLLAIGLYLQYSTRRNQQKRKAKEREMKMQQEIDETMKELKILKNRRNPRAQGKTYNLILHVDFGEALFLMPGIGMEEEADKNMTYEQLFANLGKRLDKAVNDPMSYKQELLTEYKF